MSRGVIAVTVWLSAFACGRSSREEALVVYACGPRPLAERLVAGFTEQRGVRVELFCATTGQIMAKLEAERFRPRADVVLLASQFAAEWLATKGRLRAYRPDALATNEFDWQGGGASYHATAAAVIGVALRRDADAEDLTWDDVWSGRRFERAVMPSPSRSGSSADFILSWVVTYGEAGFDDLRRARRNGLEIAGANSQAITSLKIGAHQAVVGAVDYLVYREIERGEPIVMRYPRPGSAVVLRPVAILATTTRARDAERFVDFLFERRAQEWIAAEHMIPARRDVPRSEVRRSETLPAAWSVDLDAAVASQRSTLRRFQYEVERAVVLEPADR